MRQTGTMVATMMCMGRGMCMCCCCMSCAADAQLYKEQEAKLETCRRS